MDAITELLFNMWLILSMAYTIMRLIDLIHRWDDK